MQRFGTKRFPPRRLGIYYGWPSLFNGSRDLQAAIAAMGQYGVMVLGWGVQEPKHGDHENAAAIIKALVGRTEVYGYIPLGESTGLSDRKIRKAAKLWRALGVRGVLLDEAGYDFGNTRKRQNKAYDAVHDLGLGVIANGWAAEDLLGTERGKFNKDGSPPSLRRGDYLLYESYRICDGQLEDADDWRAKIEALGAAGELGVGLMGVTTGKGHYDQQRNDHVLYCAILDGLDAVGWGEREFAAPDNVMPLRPWPTLGAPMEIQWLSEVKALAGQYSRETSIGTVSVDRRGGGQINLSRD